MLEVKKRVKKTGLINRAFLKRFIMQYMDINVKSIKISDETVEQYESILIMAIKNDIERYKYCQVPFKN